MHHGKALAWAGILGATGVLFGAFGAHALNGYLSGLGTAGTWETAVRYQMVHAVALLALAGWIRAGQAAPRPRTAWAVRLWGWGTILFSGSLFLLALGAPRWMGAVTPLGGLALIAGWVMAAASAAG